MEIGNVHDTFAVAVMRSDTIAGHCPRKISAICFIFIRRGGRITCQMTGGRRHLSDLPQGGLEVPCVLKFQTSSKQYAEKTEKLIRNSLSKNIKDIPHTSVDSTSGQDAISASGLSADSGAPISIENDENPAKKLKLISKEFEGEEIIMGNELSDQHINKAQNLLKVQFPQLNRLTSSLLQAKELQPTGSVKNKVQIIHCSERHHWVVATTVNCRDGQVLVIDSVYRSLDDETKNTVCRLFQNGSKHPVTKVISPQKQKGDKDCGLFAIAYVTAIAFSQFPAKKTFRQESLRAHLVTCFQHSKMSPFP